MLTKKIHDGIALNYLDHSLRDFDDISKTKIQIDHGTFQVSPLFRFHVVHVWLHADVCALGQSHNIQISLKLARILVAFL